MPDTPVRPPLPLWAATIVAVGAGALLTLAFPAAGWWWMVFVAVPLSLVPLIGRSLWGSLLVGFGFGAAFFLINVSFTARYLGPVPWLALSVLEAALTAVAGLAITLAYRWVPRVVRADAARLAVLPVLVAGLWTMRELILGSWPYGGFPWGRIGVTQVDGPIAELVSWVGMSGVSFLVVLLCAFAIETVRRVRGRRLILATVPAVALAIVLVAVPAFPTVDAGSMRVGAVQGNGPTGYFDERAAGEILQSQLEATAPLVGEDLDLLLWPEGSVDSDPLNNASTAAVLELLAERLDAPLLVNGVTERDGALYNTSVLWEAGEGAVALYDKTHPVPFGEYVPDRSFYQSLAPDLIGLIGRDYAPGTLSPVVEVSDVGVGLGICFDVIYDDVVWAGAEDGAQVYMFQTNNADFRGTDENLQQLAFARVRAIETGRAVVNISTVGTSQVILPDGSVIDEIGVDEAGVMLTDVPLRTGLTPATVIGGLIQLVLGWGSAAALGVFGVLVLRRRSTGGAPDSKDRRSAR